MTAKIVAGIEYRENTAGQWIAQRFEVQRFIQDNRISTITGGQALRIIFSAGIERAKVLPCYQLPLEIH